MITRIFAGFLLLVTIICLSLFLINTNAFVTPSGRDPIILAHRGIAPRYDTRNIKSDTCTASRMLPSDDVFIENTIASMEAAFTAGADVVEIDVHPTIDGEFAVFHDWRLECRTNGQGVTREHTMADLKKLDVGYGYTADGGHTFPFRGKGVGMMPTLREVLEKFPTRRFLINIKSNDPNEANLLVDYLAQMSSDMTTNLIVYGGQRPAERLKDLMPDLKVTSRGSALACLTSYQLWGWSGIVPDACRGGVVYIPINMASRMWGWPDRMLNRFEEAGSDVFIIGPYEGGNYSSGVDTTTDVRALPPHWSGGIMTNELEAIAPLIRKKS